MNVRLGNPQDAAEVGVLLKKIWAMHAENNPDFMNGKKIKAYSKSHMEKYLDVCFDKNKKSFLLIAEENKTIAGFLKIDIVEIQNFFLESKVLYLDDIFVKEEYRGRGVAKLLQTEAEKVAKNHKIKMLKARIYTFNTPAQKMAASMGMKALYSEYFKPL